MHAWPCAYGSVCFPSDDVHFAVASSVYFFSPENDFTSVYTGTHDVHASLCFALLSLEKSAGD